AELIVLETDVNGAAEAEKPAAAPATPAKEQAAASSTAASAPAPTPATGSNGAAQPQPSSKPPGGRVMASPATRARAKQSGIDLSTVVGTGRDGRIQRQDLEAAIQERQAGRALARETTAGGGRPQART